MKRRVALLLLVFVTFFLASPVIVGSSVANADGICDMSSTLSPEVVGSGVDGLVKPPPPDDGVTGGGTGVGIGLGADVEAPAQALKTNYENYGMSGQFWHTYELGCSDVAAVIGNAWANAIFSWAKAVDRLTITTYEAAATEGPLLPIKNVVDDIVTNLADAMYWPFLRPIVIIAAIWLAWYGLLRKRATTTAEAVVWMVLAVTVATWFFSRPQDLTNVGKTITDKTTEIVNSAFSGLPGAGGASCLPPPASALGAAAGAATGAAATPGAAPPVTGGGYGQPGTPGVQQNADALWSTLVCKPWLMGNFGTADPASPIVAAYGAKLLDTQALDATEQQAQQSAGTDAHQRRYEEEVANPLRTSPAFYLLQGKDWTSRLGVAIGAFIAAMVAGLLIFLVAVSLLVLKVGFLLLLIMGPIFLLIGVHPGTGRIIAMRWVEMLVGTLLRQAVLALVLGVLVYGYALIISTPLPWGMQIMFMALMTLAVFFYRRPFQHLFSSMSGSTLATRMLGDATTAPTLQRAAGALPPVAAARMGRWGLRKAEPMLNAAIAGSTGGASGAATAAAGVAQGKVRGEERVGARANGQPAPLENPEQAARRKTGVPPPRTGAAPPLNLSRPPATTRPSAPAPAPVRASSSGGGGGGGGGWFSGRSGGWASRPSASRGSSSGGGGGILGGGFFGGGGRSSSGGSSSRRSAPQQRPRSEPTRAPRSESPRPAERPSRSSDAPPLWLPGRSDSGRGGGSGGGSGSGDGGAPFWLRPRDKD
ncbi:type IV secretion system protein [Herbidospora mongoliensis]|uniref:type IV secretion system protein n=1 Tax=Herbidospora mongoliensis TaxID=688067 RepID=UPI00082DD28D|nr:type IV secretion system protein [Herbidospora mongoliensis]